MACLRPEGKACLTLRWAGRRACWAAGSPAKAAMACSGSTLATARMAPGTPREPAMRRIIAAPTYRGWWNTSSSARRRSGSPLESFMPWTGRSGEVVGQGRRVAGGLGDGVVVGAGVAGPGWAEGQDGVGAGVAGRAGQD